MKNKKVYVATSADIIHVGHLNIIKGAAKLEELTGGFLTDIKKLPVPASLYNKVIKSKYIKINKKL